MDPEFNAAEDTEDEDLSTETPEDQEQEPSTDEAPADAQDDGEAAASEEAPKPKLTGKARAKERARAHRELQEQVAAQSRQIAQMAAAMERSAHASTTAAEAMARATTRPEKPWEEVAQERIRAAAAAAGAAAEGPAAVAAANEYHRVLFEVNQETIRREAARAAQQQPRPLQLSPREQEIVAVAPWLTPTQTQDGRWNASPHFAPVIHKFGEILKAKGFAAGTAVPERVRDAAMNEAIAHYAAYSGLKANLPAASKPNTGAVTGASARSFAGGGTGDSSGLSIEAMPEFMKSLAVEKFPGISPEKAYRRYLDKIVIPEARRQKSV